MYSAKLFFDSFSILHSCIKHHLADENQSSKVRSTIHLTFLFLQLSKNGAKIESNKVTIHEHYCCFLLKGGSKIINYGLADYVTWLLVQQKPYCLAYPNITHCPTYQTEALGNKEKQEITKDKINKQIRKKYFVTYI